MSPAEDKTLRRPRWGRFLAFALVIFVGLITLFSIGKLRPDPVPEDANPDTLKLADLAEVPTDFFHDMDGGIQLTEAEIKGRNTWMLWSAGNADFWNWLAQYGFGTNDLLKTLDTRGRPRRFREMGLINEPGFRAATQPDSLGVWLDEPVAPRDNLDDRVYGRQSGVVGLRLFRNPKFDRKKWDPKRYYSDARYYNDKKLERPYMVGMSCGFCHVGPNPTNPPANPESPEWANLSTYIGAQYFRTGKVFGGAMSDSSIVYQILAAMADGTLDTSFLATDNILNPSSMNAIFEVAGRLAAAENNPEEEMGEPTMNVRGQKQKMHVPHILKDGADNIGIVGALSRVYINIGEYHDEWLRNHNILVGGKAQSPFQVARAQKQSIYWLSTEDRVNNLAAFFVKAAKPFDLKDAPGGLAYLTADTAVLSKGKIAFANSCASCHSSKQPPAAIATDSEAVKGWFREAIQHPDFAEGNFFSDDRRYPVSLIQTNACRALATNSTRGHVWDNFSSETYKHSKPSGPIQVYNPFTRDTATFQPPAGGVGYYRTPSLISVWATAPFFHNNELGNDTLRIGVADPSVAGRMRAFDVAIEQLLWPEKRRGIESIRRTTRESWIQIPTAYLPRPLKSLAEGDWHVGGIPMPYMPGFMKAIDDNDGYLRIGPIPKGTPLKLIANVDLTFDTPELDRKDLGKAASLTKLGAKVKKQLLEARGAGSEAARTEVMRKLAPDLLARSKCPDFIEDRGHYFGRSLPDSTKRALIEYLKTL